MKTPKKRSKRGNMLVFITASTFILVGCLAFFALGYVRLLGSNNEQKTAIEAAALSAARDVSRIVIQTPEYGWIGVSDSAPNGAGTVADDNYYVPVRGINTIIGTNRICRIIAAELNDDTLKTMVNKDLEWAKKAQAKLKAELDKAMAKGYVAKDSKGQNVEVYKNAEDAYKANGVRMTGASDYVDGSLKLTLGSLSSGAPTNVPLPRPLLKAQVPAAAQTNNFYLSYTNVPVQGVDYVFAGIGDAIKLVDSKKWVASNGSLPYEMPTIVKAEAEQQLKGDQVNGYKVRAVACAQPANVTDPKPFPGAFTFSFPDGLCPEIPNPGALLTYANAQKPGITASWMYAKDGDYPVEQPVATMQNLGFPYDGLLPVNTGVAFRRGLIDWWKRAGTKLNISSAVAMLNDATYKFQEPNPKTVHWKTPAKVGDSYKYDLGPIPNGNIHIYRVDPNSGGITYQAKQLDPIEIPIAPENQLYSESLDVVKNSSVGKQTVGPFMFPNTGDLFDQVYLLPNFDVYVRDMVYQPGGTWGGKHGGEPMNHPKTAFLKPTPGLMELGSGGLGAKPKPYDDGGDDKPYTPPKPKGSGLPPAITSQSDLAETAGYPATFYQKYQVGSGLRPTYTQNGMAVDVRFRRQVDAGTFEDVLGFKIGYVGEKYGDDVPAVSMQPYVPPVVADPPADTGTGTTGTDTGTTGTDTGTTGTDPGTATGL